VPWWQIFFCFWFIQDHLCDRQIKMTERHAAQAPALRERFHKSSIINHQSSIINSQSGSGFAGLGF